MRKQFAILQHIGCALLCVLFGVRVAVAATLADVSDQVTTLVASAAANHRFALTIVNGVDEGDTLTIGFDDFSLTDINEDDVDIADDGVDLTTATSCTGTEEASVTVNTIPSIITITICSGDGGAIAAGSEVVIEVGTNASASGSGTHRVTNPSATGTYFIALGGSLGDSGSVPVSIVGDDNEGVSAIIPADEDEPDDDDGGGGGPPPGGDSGDDTGDGDTTDPDSDVTDPDEETDDSSPDPEPQDPETDTDGETDTSDGEGSSDNVPTTPSSTDGGGGDRDDRDTGGSTGEPEMIIDSALVLPGLLLVEPESSIFSVLGGTHPTLRVDVDGYSADQISVIVNGVETVLGIEDGTSSVFSGEITIPGNDTLLIVEVVRNGEVTQKTYTLDVRGTGGVYEATDNGLMPIEGSVVTVYKVVNGARVAWTGGENPVVVGSDGAIAWYVENGTYVVVASKTGYEDGSSGLIAVRNHILAPSILLERVAPEQMPDDATTPGDTSGTPPVTSSDAGSSIASLVVDVFTERLEEIRALPEIQVAVNVATPVTAVLAGTSVVVLASSFQLLPLLQYLITSPVLFFARRKRKAFGVVYNAASKLPVDLAIVRLYALPERKLVRTVVTDQHGQYLLTALPGRYLLEAQKPNFSFPSVLLKGQKDDGTYLDVYTGQEIEVTEREATIAANIALDPSQSATQVPQHIALKRFLRTLQATIAVAGIVLATAVLVLSPSLLAGAMVSVQIIVYLFVRRLAHAKKPKGWGIVYDAHTKQPVGNAVVRLFEPTYNKLIETVITDRLGRYAFLVGPNEYYISYAKPGYTEKVVRPVDYRTEQEPATVTLEVGLEGT